MKYNSDDRYISQITAWIRTHAKVLSNKISEQSLELKKITDKLWNSAIDMKNRKFKFTTEGFEYNIHEVALFILISDSLFLYRYYGPSGDFFRQLGHDPIRYLKEIYHSLKVVGYYPFFGSMILELLPERDELLKDIILRMFRLISEIFDQNDHDILGKIFNELIPSEIRRRMGAFFTTDVYASLLSMLAISRYDLKVLDLSCGTGSLLNEALIRKYDLYRMKHEETEKSRSHRNIKEAVNQEKMGSGFLLRDMFGCDILQYSVALASLNLIKLFLKTNPHISGKPTLGLTLGDTQDQLATDEMPSIHVFMVDALSIMPDIPFTFVGRPSNQKKIQGVQHQGLIPCVDVVLMNPPFSMSRSMDSDLKRVLLDRMANLGLQKYVDKNMGLHGYFILHSNQFLIEGGVMCLIIPASTFDSDYSLPLIRFLKDHKYRIDYLIEILSESSAFSYNCSFKEIIFIGTKGVLTADSSTLIVSIIRDIDYSELPELYESVVHEKPGKLAVMKRVKTYDLYEKGHWTRFFDEDRSILDRIFMSGHCCTLSEASFLQLIRGFDGTYLEFVCIPNKFWEVKSASSSNSTSNSDQSGNSEYVEITGRTCAMEQEHAMSGPILIPRRFLLPSIRSSKYIPGIIGLPTHFVFDISDDIVAQAEFPSIKTRYFDMCSKLMLERWTEKTRNGHYQRDPPDDWYRHPNRNNCRKTIGHIIHLYKYSFSTRSSVVVYCPREISVSNGFGYVIRTPDDEFYMAWFCSTLYLYVLFKNQKSYSKGFFKVMVETLNKVYVPNYPQHATASEKIKEAYRKLCAKESLPSLKIQIETCLSERVSLDHAWLEFLGYSENEIKEILNTLYKYCVASIQNR